LVHPVYIQFSKFKTWIKPVDEHEIAYIHINKSASELSNSKNK